MKKLKMHYTKDYALAVDGEAAIKGKGWRVDLERNTLGFIDSDEYYNRTENKNKFALVVDYYPQTKEAKELDLPLLPSFENKVNTIIQTRNFNKQVKNPYLTEEKEYQVWERAYIEGFDDGIAQSKQFSLEGYDRVC